jgi:hypothetical protein
MKRAMFIVGGLLWLGFALGFGTFLVRYILAGAGIQFFGGPPTSGSVLLGLVHVIGFATAILICFAIGVGLSAHGIVGGKHDDTRAGTQIITPDSMSDILTTEPLEACSWCGKQNAQRLANCAGCGTRLVAEAAPAPTLDEVPKPKSKLLAVCLTLIFGPLGLIYVEAWATLVLLIAVALPFVFTHRGGLWLTFGGRILCAAIAYCLVEENGPGPNANRDATRLLNAAARLENTNREEAILAYEEIIRLYPNTRASKEARSNIEILKQPVERNR